MKMIIRYSLITYSIIILMILHQSSEFHRPKIVSWLKNFTRRGKRKMEPTIRCSGSGNSELDAQLHHTHAKIKYDLTLNVPVANSPYYVVPALENHTATVIFFHGLCGTGYRWSQDFFEIIQPYMKLVCPNANSMFVATEKGFKVPAWFDDFPDGRDDIKGIDRATKYVHNLIKLEIKEGIPSNRIIIAGYDQGGALALHSALTFPERLAAIVALSTWLPMNATLQEYTKTVNRNIPILQCHGDKDQFVPHGKAEYAASLLKTVSENVDFKLYAAVRHGISDEGMQDIKNFMKKHVAAI